MVALIDGEHYPPVVRFALSALAGEHEVAAAVFLGGTEKVDEKEYLTNAFAREAVSFIDRHKEKPFFLYLPFNAVHDPLQAPEKYKNSFPAVTGPRARIWAGQLKAMDDAVGRVLAKVSEAGLERDTLIFFVGDNGGYPLGNISPNAPLNGRKGDTYEGGVRIPFMMQWKGRLQAGRVYEKPVISLDILPTALALAGGKAGANVEGVDLMPFLDGKNPGVPHDRLFWRLCEKSGARVGDWKLVRNGDGSEKLFDLASDIGEQKDLAAANPEKLKELQAAYSEWDSRNIPPRWIDGRKKAKDAGKGE
jgi:arylsulfatase A-like enzyme